MRSSAVGEDTEPSFAGQYANRNNRYRVTPIWSCGIRQKQKDGHRNSTTHNTTFSIAAIMYALRVLMISAMVLTVQRLARWTAKPNRAASGNETA
jgi:hypothetical protein